MRAMDSRLLHQYIIELIMNVLVGKIMFTNILVVFILYFIRYIGI